MVPQPVRARRGRLLEPLTLIAGHHADGGTSSLYAWNGAGAATPVPIDLDGYNPEGFFTPEERDDILVVSDDGTQEIDGAPCKELDDPTRKRFRGVWMRLPPAR